jgi:hypothetical protein
MQLMIDKTEFAVNVIKKIAVYLRYGKRETIALFVAVCLFSAAIWLAQSVPDWLKPIVDYQPQFKPIATYAMFVVACLIVTTQL